MSESDDRLGQPDDPALLTWRNRAWQKLEHVPVRVATLALTPLPTSPFSARRYARSFLSSCPGVTSDTAQTAELIVSELVTNAVKHAVEPSGIARDLKQMAGGPISLSLRDFDEVLLIEVYDTDSNPPVLSTVDDGAEGGRGLMLVDALSKEWSYSFPPGGGKIVYCLLEKS